MVDASQRIERSVTIQASADDVWRVVRDFFAIAEWHPTVPEPKAIPGSPGDCPGATRVFNAGTASESIERLIEHNDEGRFFVYELLNPRFPITDHRGRITVSPDALGAVVQWVTTFHSTDETAVELDGVLGDGVFAPGLTALSRREWSAQGPGTA
nr:SRPBCC family protein [Rhodococcus wratislaviensis]GLK34014.1 hypothetical protein GCM10017611_08570 [Rhodococcus wratislaviensis]